MSRVHGSSTELRQSVTAVSFEIPTSSSSYYSAWTWNRQIYFGVTAMLSTLLLYFGGNRGAVGVRKGDWVELRKNVMCVYFRRGILAYVFDCCCFYFEKGLMPLDLLVPFSLAFTFL